MTSAGIQEIRLEAQRQLDKERFEEAVRAEITRLKAHRPWWHKIFPYAITIRRRK